MHPEAPTLDLALPRRIILSDARSPRRFAFACRRVLDADWRAYFDAILISSSYEGSARVNTLDLDSPYLALVDRVLQGAEGYEVPGFASIEALNNWQRRIPVGHRRALGRALADVRPSAQQDSFRIEPEGEVAYVDAAWSSADGASIVKFERLEHVLAAPTEKQHRRYAAEASRSRVVGGSRSGQTIYHGAQQVLAALYDELVVRVDPAYRVDGRPLATREEIVREMDILHKVVAAQQVFAPEGELVPVGAEASAE